MLLHDQEASVEMRSCFTLSCPSLVWHLIGDTKLDTGVTLKRTRGWRVCSSQLFRRVLASLKEHCHDDTYVNRS